MIALGILLCLGGVGALGYLHLNQATASTIAKKEKNTKKQDSEQEKKQTQPPRVKTPEEKQAVIDEDRLENRKPVKAVASAKIDGAITCLMDFWLFNHFKTIV